MVRQEQMLSGLPDVSEMEAADSGFDRTCEAIG